MKHNEIDSSEHSRPLKNVEHHQFHGIDLGFLPDANTLPFLPPTLHFVVLIPVYFTNFYHTRLFSWTIHIKIEGAHTLFPLHTSKHSKAHSLRQKLPSCPLHCPQAPNLQRHLLGAQRVIFVTSDASFS